MSEINSFKIKIKIWNLCSGSRQEIVDKSRYWLIKSAQLTWYWSYSIINAVNELKIRISTPNINYDRLSILYISIIVVSHIYNTFPAMLYADKKFQLINFYNIGGNEIFCKIEKNTILCIRAVVPRGSRAYSWI